MNAPDWTPEPWTWFAGGLRGENGKWALDDTADVLRYEADLARTSKCVNALAGLNPDAISEIVSALTAIVNEHPDPSNNHDIERARTALTKLNGAY